MPLKVGQLYTRDKWRNRGFDTIILITEIIDYGRFPIKFQELMEPEYTDGAELEFFRDCNLIGEVTDIERLLWLRSSG